ncbi:MAG: hypothetical protein ACQESQ_12355 [Bacteroidota bacterium]
MDYLCIGSNGFAQVGDPEYFEKNKSEMRVLMEYLQSNHPIPDEFWHMCDYRVKWFTHDFGRYSEIVMIYDDYTLNQWDENDTEKFDRFWNWFNEIEAVDLETDSLTIQIKTIYFTSIKLKDTG